MARTIKKSVLLLLAAAVLLASSCDMDAFRKSGKVYIVSVGLDYRNSEGANSLNGTVNDAVEVMLALEAIYDAKGIGHESFPMMQQGTDPDMQASDYPSADNVLAALDRIPAGPDDLIVFYYSGHGDIDADKQGYFITASTYASPLYTRLAMKDVFSLLQQKRCAAVMLLDCCYSGSAAGEAMEVRTFADAFTHMFESPDLRNVSVVCASQPEELSYTSSTTTVEGRVEYHSAFTIALLRQLGWIHSYAVEQDVESAGCVIAAHGYLDEVPSRTTTEKLMETVESGWYDLRQTPYMNSTNLGVALIP